MLESFSFLVPSLSKIFTVLRISTWFSAPQLSNEVDITLFSNTQSFANLHTGETGLLSKFMKDGFELMFESKIPQHQNHWKQT